jgi:hypothetical protein
LRDVASKQVHASVSALEARAPIGTGRRYRRALDEAPGERNGTIRRERPRNHLLVAVAEVPILVPGLYEDNATDIRGVRLGEPTDYPSSQRLADEDEG